MGSNEGAVDGLVESGALNVAVTFAEGGAVFAGLTMLGEEAGGLTVVCVVRIGKLDVVPAVGSAGAWLAGPKSIDGGATSACG